MLEASPASNAPADHTGDRQCDQPLTQPDGEPSLNEVAVKRRVTPVSPRRISTPLRWRSGLPMTSSHHHPTIDHDRYRSPFTGQNPKLANITTGATAPERPATTRLDATRGDPPSAPHPPTQPRPELPACASLGVNPTAARVPRVRRLDCGPSTHQRSATAHSDANPTAAPSDPPPSGRQPIGGPERHQHPDASPHGRNPDGGPSYTHIARPAAHTA